MASLKDWHESEAADVLRELASDGSRGLSHTEAASRLAEYGPNELQPAGVVSAWTILLGQFKNVLIVILVMAGALSAFLGHSVEAAAIIIIMLVAVLLGFLQEYRMEHAIEALRQRAPPTASVVREGEELTLAARELVPGDLILLQAGNKVPADARLVETVNLQIEEAALTGESVPAEKQTVPLADGSLALADRKNMVYAGTTVTYGRGRAVVVATALETEFGKIARALGTVEAGDTPLQENLDRVGRALARGALVVVAVVVVLGLSRGLPLVEMLVFGVALAVAIVPEALPAVVTISLALGVQRMAKRNALIRRLLAVETLGSTSVICSDKTGTLTKGEMTVRKIFAAGETFEIAGAGFDPRGEFQQGGQTVDPPDALVMLLRAAVCASDARLVERDRRWSIKGDPTEGALVIAAAKAGIIKDDLERQLPRIQEIPFASETKRMTTLHSTEAGAIAYSKGAPEVILGLCNRQLTGCGEISLDDFQRDALLAKAREMANEALRVLAIAAKPNATLESAEREMTFLGLVGMIDPPRPEARAAIRKCEEASIRPVMITGDHPTTALAVARELSLLRDGRIITGAELEILSDAELEREVETIAVYARVSPAHKLRVVTALQKKGHVVTMTGYGINDAPALKKADVGVAMGITGTDVSREAAAITLTDDNFASIVAAVEEGRGIFSNIKKYLMYLLSSNIGEIGLMLGAALAGLPTPLTAVQILYVNLATDGLPALALAADPPEAGLMRRPPRNPRRGIFTRPVLVLMAAGGLWSTIANLSLYSWLLRSGRGLSHAMATTFVALVLIEFFKAYSFRSDRNSVFNRPFSNRWLNLAIVWELALLAGIVHAPLLREAFGTSAFLLPDWVAVMALALTILPVVEIIKWSVRRGWFGELD